MDKTNKEKSELLPQAGYKSNYSKIPNIFVLLVLFILTFFFWFTFFILLLQHSQGAIIWYFMAVGLSLFLIYSK